MAMKKKVDNFLYEELSYKIRGAIFEVYKSLGNGHKEIVYKKAFKKALIKRGLNVETERRIDIIFENEKVGTYVPDLVIEDKIIVEVKAKPFLTKKDKEQFWHYLKSTNYKLGLLVNFGSYRRVEIYRRVYDTARSAAPSSAKVNAEISATFCV